MSKIIGSILSPCLKTINGCKMVEIKTTGLKPNYKWVKGNLYVREMVKKDGGIGRMYCGPEQALEVHTLYEFVEKMDEFYNNALPAGSTGNNNEDEMTKNEDRDYTGETNEWESEDILRPLPNWESMELGEILQRVSYHKRQHKNGVSWLAPMKDEHGQLIPVKRDWDHSTMGYNRWGSDLPVDTQLAVAAKAEAYLLEWGIPMEMLNQAVRNCISSTCSNNIAPFKDAEAVIDWLLEKRLEKYQKPINKGKVWLKKVFGEGVSGVYRDVKTMVEVAYIDCLNAEPGFDYEKAIETSKRLVRIMTDRNGNVINTDEPMGFILSQFQLGTRLEKSAWVTVAGMINALLWGNLTGGLRRESFSPAVEGTITRYVSSMIRLEMFSVLSEEGHVDRQIIDGRTPTSERFKMEEADYVWRSRE